MKRIYRSESDRLIAGVCGGIAQYFVIDPTIVRLVLVAFTLFGGAGVLAYVVAWIVVPDERKTQWNINLHAIKQNPLWGILLIGMGGIWFLRYEHIFVLFWGIFWYSAMNMILVITLIVSGIYLFYNRIFQGDENSEGYDPLHLADQDKKLAGVCGGLGESLYIDPTIIRALWVFGSLMSIGIGLLIYIILAIILPERSIIPEDI